MPSLFVYFIGTTEDAQTADCNDILPNMTAPKDVDELRTIEAFLCQKTGLQSVTICNYIQL